MPEEKDDLLNIEEIERRIQAEIREKVFAKSEVLQKEKSKVEETQATLDALEGLTEVPRTEMERIAREVRKDYELELKKSLPSNVQAQANLPVISLPANLPATVQNDIGYLPEHLQREFKEEYEIIEKSSLPGYLFMFFLFFLSPHYLYMRKWFLQAAYTFSFAGLGIWWIIDLVRMPKLVKETNRDTAYKLLKKLTKEAERQHKREKKQKKEEAKQLKEIRKEEEKRRKKEEKRRRKGEFNRSIKDLENKINDVWDNFFKK